MSIGFILELHKHCFIKQEGRDLGHICQKLPTTSTNPGIILYTGREDVNFRLWKAAQATAITVASPS